MELCPANQNASCAIDRHCEDCVYYPCKHTSRYKKGSPPPKTNCFRCKYAKAGTMQVVCTLGKLTI